MKTDKLSMDEVRDMFEEAFNSQVATDAGIESFEITCERSTDGKITAEVTVYGMAGSPSINDFKTGKIKSVDTVTISRADVGDMTFAFQKENIVYLNGMDYLLTYVG